MSSLNGSWIEIFRAGDYGERGRWTPEDLDRIAASYSSRLHPAPVVVGHPSNDSPAYGWIARLRRAGQSLWAQLEKVDRGFEQLLREGRFRQRSVALYKNFPPTGSPYLRHVGFLGAAAPAVKGLAPVRFAEAPLFEFTEPISGQHAECPVGQTSLPVLPAPELIPEAVMSESRLEKFFNHLRAFFSAEEPTASQPPAKGEEDLSAGLSAVALAKEEALAEEEPVLANPSSPHVGGLPPTLNSKDSLEVADAPAFGRAQAALATAREAELVLPVTPVLSLSRLSRRSEAEIPSVAEGSEVEGSEAEGFVPPVTLEAGPTAGPPRIFAGDAGSAGRGFPVPSAVEGSPAEKVAARAATTEGARGKPSLGSPEEEPASTVALAERLTQLEQRFEVLVDEKRVVDDKLSDAQDSVRKAETVNFVEALRARGQFPPVFDSLGVPEFLERLATADASFSDSGSGEEAHRDSSPVVPSAGQAATDPVFVGRGFPVLSAAEGNPAVKIAASAATTEGFQGNPLPGSPEKDPAAQPLLTWFQEFLTQLPQFIEFRELTEQPLAGAHVSRPAGRIVRFAEPSRGVEVDPESVELAERAESLAEEQGITYAEALAQLRPQQRHTKVSV